jgi:hypothetical protein
MLEGRSSLIKIFKPLKHRESALVFLKLKNHVY